MDRITHIDGIPLIWDEALTNRLIAPLGLTLADKQGRTLRDLMTSGSESLFKNSPFGENWNKRLALGDWEKDKHKDDPPGSAWYYHLETGTDGAELIEMYLKDTSIPPGYGSDKDQLTDLSIYYETDNGYNSLGSVCFVKMNGALYDLLTNTKDGDYWRNWLVNDIVDNQVEKNHITLNAKRLREAIDNELDEGGGMDMMPKIGSWLLRKLADLIRKGLIPEKSWNANLEDYDPLLPIGNIHQAIQSWKRFKKRTEAFFEDAGEAGEWCKNNIPFTGELLQKFIEAIIDVCGTVIDAIDSIVQVIDSVVEKIRLINAFICGVFNELIEMAAGLVDLAALMLSLTDNAERQLIEEALENIIESFIKEPGKLSALVKEGYNNLLERYSDDKTAYEKAYHLGEDVVLVLSLLELVYSIIKSLLKLPKSFTRLKEWLKKIKNRSPSVRNAEIAERLKKIRFKYLEKPVINLKWRVWVSHTVLDIKRVRELEKLRAAVKAIAVDNIATLKVKVFLKDGTVKEFEYIAHAGKGKKIRLEGSKPDVVGAPEVKSNKDFLDYSFDEDINRWYDSENKMMVQMDKDLAGLEVKSTTMEIESTFTPCIICRREILVRREMYNAKVFVKSSKFSNPVTGKLEQVKNNTQFKILLTQIK